MYETESSEALVDVEDTGELTEAADAFESHYEEGSEYAEGVSRLSPGSSLVVAAQQLSLGNA